MAMMAPHYISENKSDMRGIKHGWYAVEDDGKLSSGLFPAAKSASRESTGQTANPDAELHTSNCTLRFMTSGVEGGAGKV
jgi:hypothetical protein